MSKHSKVTYSTDSAARITSDQASTEIRKPMCAAMDEPSEGAFVKEMVRCKYAVEPGQKLCAKHIFIQEAKCQ